MARILVVNAGSSTVKLSLIGEEDESLWRRELQTPHAELDQTDLHGAIEEIADAVDAVGHRIVHGGERFQGPTRIDAQVEATLRDLTELAPLHQPKSLAALDAVSAALPNLPAFACFDTSFHAELPPGARTYALPAAWRQRWPIRRYGFHGLSHGWVARRMSDLVGASARVVSCHLGAGASLCAIASGRSVATTMGFTPLEGLVMATRSGSVDPGLLLWLLEHSGMSEQELGHALEHESGLLGLAGSSDMREILQAFEEGDGNAQLALAVYLERLRAGIAAMAAALEGVDALVFTGGVGERSTRIRAEAAAGLRFIGVGVDAARNTGPKGDREITLDRVPVRTFVIVAREDLEIARQVRPLLIRSSPTQDRLRPRR
jgi:acetate kinase